MQGGSRILSEKLLQDCEDLDTGVFAVSASTSRYSGERMMDAMPLKSLGAAYEDSNPRLAAGLSLWCLDKIR